MLNRESKTSKNNQIKVSVIVPVYNVALYLEKCLDSIIGQTLKEIEIICVNDGSTDDSTQILDSYAQTDSRIKVVYEENKDAGLTRMIGLKLAKGEYIGFVDSDDWIDLNYFETLYINAKNKNADIARTNYKYNYKDGRVELEEYLYNIINKKAASNEDLNANEHSVVIWNAIYKREFLEKNNINYFNAKLFGVEDVPFTARVTYFSKKTIPVKGTFYNHRTERENQLTQLSLNRIKGLVVANLIISEFFNTHKIRDKNEYLAAYKRILWRFDYNFIKALDLEDFTIEEQDEYIKVFIEVFHKCRFLKKLIKNYNEPYFKFLFKKEVEGYRNFVLTKGANILETDFKEYFQKVIAQKQIDKLIKQYKNKKIAIYGAGQYCKTLFKNYDLSKLNIVAIADKTFEDESKRIFFNLNCITPNDLKKLDCDIILLGVYDPRLISNYLKKELLVNCKNSKTKIKQLIKQSFWKLV